MPETMHIAIPTDGAGGLDAPRSGHFGRSDSFTIVHVSDGAISGESSVANPPHESGGCSRVVDALAEQGVSVAIVAGVGGGPLSAMNRLGIEVYHDSASPTPRAAAEAFLRGALMAFDGSTSCGAHSHHHDPGLHMW